jgi:GNAT superfamily N-acetyltransferase
VDVNGDNGVEVGRVVEIRRVRYDAIVAQALMAAALADLRERYEDDEGDGTPISATDFEPPAGAFLVAYLDGEPVACGGWRSYGESGTVAELKRMYTTPAARGQGVARRLLAAIEDSARSYGRTRMILETGVRQPEAIKLYESTGYEGIAPFGHYRDHPEVVSLGRNL